MLRAALWGVRKLDEVNLLPGFMIDGDPLFTSVMVANLGSLGLDHTFHHLYEYGNTSFFACLGAPRKGQVVTRRGDVEVRDILDVRWTMDERVADGYEAGMGLRWAQAVVENPEKYIGSPEAAAGGEIPKFVREAA